MFFYKIKKRNKGEKKIESICKVKNKKREINSNKTKKWNKANKKKKEC